MSFKQEEIASTLNCKALNILDLFIYIDSNISPTESDVNILLVKTWTAIVRFSILWKSDLFDKKEYLLRCSCVYTNVWMYPVDANEKA